jgi:hypothetical protein
MAKKTPEQLAIENQQLALNYLMAALEAPNPVAAPGVETARLDAAELILKLATQDETEALDAALDFLVDAMKGAVPTLTAALRTRAAAVYLRHARGSL